MKSKIVVLLFVLSTVHVALAQKEEIVPYINFLKTQHTDPVDYVFQMFEKYDIVILGERDHRDTTQYVLIDKIISDPRFIAQVGNVFTEVGVNNRTEWANKVLKGSYQSQDAFENELRKLYRDADFEILWDKYNFWMFLSNVYRINKNLLENEKINVYFTDCFYDWYECTSVEQRKNVYGRIFYGGIRDSIMGHNFIKDYNQLLLDKNNARKKALVIFNRPHSYKNYEYYKRGKLIKSAASYIFNEYPDKVANIMINWVKINGNGYLIANGKWDATFQYLRNPSLGFDFANSPFATDLFDDIPSHTGEIIYGDLYTGFIFYKPVEEWAAVIGIPDIVDEEFLPEFERRLFLNSDTWSLEEKIDYYNTVRTVDHYPENMPRDSVKMHINYWLR